MITNCGKPTERVFEFLDNQLQLIMGKGSSYIKDLGDFVNKIWITNMLFGYTLCYGVIP